MNQIDSSRVFICGTVRNCERFLEPVFNNIKKIIELFSDFHIIISFDDSIDNTLLVLTQYKQIFGDKMDILVNRNPLSIHRTENISNARNACLNRMRVKTESGFVADYFIMMDMDDVCSGAMDIDVLKRAMNKSEQWESVSFNKHGYYDLWALSIDSYIYSYLGWTYPIHVAETMRTYIINKLSKIPLDSFADCRSAFNGFAVYKTSIFLNCHYDWRMPKQYMTITELSENKRILDNMETKSPLYEQTDEPDCEHRPFHMMAIAKYGARIRITPERLFV